MLAIQNLKLSLLVFCACLFACEFASGDIVAYRVGSPTTGTQDYGGSLGMDFDVLVPINITEMGVFDSDQDGIIGTTLTSQIWDRTSQTLIAGTTETFSNLDPGTLVEGSRFKPLGSAVLLNPGSYTINAFGYGASELNGNVTGPLDKSTNTGGGLISFVGGGRFNSTPGAFPTSIDFGPVNRYAAGTFMFAAVSVPEPSASIALLAGLVAFTLRRKSRVA